MEPEQYYRWKHANTPFSKLDAEAIGRELDLIYQRSGKRLDPTDVVEAARDPKSAMHTAFPWDDAEAARIGREEIAKRLIKSLDVKIITRERKQIDVGAFVPMPAPTGGRKTFMATTAAIKSEEGRAHLMRQAWVEILACRRRYAALNELQEVWEVVDRLESKMDKAG